MLGRRVGAGLGRQPQLVHSTLIIGSTRGWAKGVLLWNLALDEYSWAAPRRLRRLPRRGDDRLDDRRGDAQRGVLRARPRQPLRAPGREAHRVDGGADSVETVAFRNTNGSKALIAVNTAKAERTFAVWSGDRSFRFTLPAGAVVTFRWP